MNIQAVLGVRADGLQQSNHQQQYQLRMPSY